MTHELEKALYQYHCWQQAQRGSSIGFSRWLIRERRPARLLWEFLAIYHDKFFGPTRI